MNGILDLLKEVFENIKSTVDVNSVIGTPIVAGGLSIIPISKMSMGFGSGAGEIESKSLRKASDPPIGAVGGGASITPVGFLVSDGASVKYIRIEGGDSWLEAIEGILDSFAH